MPATLLIEYRYVIQYLIFAGLAGFAWVRGDGPERSVGLVFTVAILAEVVHHSIWGFEDSNDINWIHAALDAAMLVAFARIAMRANRIYTLWILAAQLIATTMHFNREIATNMHPFGYWALIRLPSYLQMLAFGIGLIAHRRRVRRGIKSKPWRNSSRPSSGKADSNLRKP